MKSSVFNPPLALCNHVKYFWSVEVDTLYDNVFSINTFVDDSSGLIFLQNYGNTSLLKNDNPVPDALIYGQATTPTKNTCVASFKALGVLFYPHAITELFNISAAELANQTVHLNDFINKEFVNQVMEFEDPAIQIQVISNFLISRLSRIKSEDKLIKNSLYKIKSSYGLVQVKELCSFYHISERQFQRRFQNTVGVSPRHYIKVIKFQEGINRIRSGKYKRLSEIAHELNYADQSHFIRHIKDLSGINPKVFREQYDSGIINLMFNELSLD
jgi:AraC-like DNA-binding protein